MVSPSQISRMRARVTRRMRSQFLAPLAAFLAIWGIMFSLKDNWGPIQTPLYESAHRVNHLFNPVASIVSGAILLEENQNPAELDINQWTNHLPTSLPLAPVTICEDSISLCIDGRRLNVTGINFFGFDGLDGMTAGLWKGPSALTMDFVNVVRRLKLLGFNAIRLPFSMKVLFEPGQPKNHTQACPMLSNYNRNPTATDILNSATRPGLHFKPGHMHIPDVRLPYEPPGSLPPDGSPGTCNAYLIHLTSTLDRFLWVINFLARNGFLVQINSQLEQDPSLLEDRSAWAEKWEVIMHAVERDPVSRARTIFDIINEPDVVSMRWETYTNSSGFVMPGAADVYHQMLAIGHEINPDSLYLINGCGQLGPTELGLTNTWGDGFRSRFTKKGWDNDLSTSAPFFDLLVNPINPKPYRNRVIISPHIYTVSVNLNGGLKGALLYKALSRSWGFLQKEGYCSLDGSLCQKFPVLIGEIGSRMRDCRNPCNNREPNCMAMEMRSLSEVAQYLMLEGEGNDLAHAPLAGWMWWAVNPNSVDTGGLFEDDWMTVLWQKVDYMVHLGLRPWYTSHCTSPPFCGVSRVITEPLHDCRTCKIANTTGLIFYHQWVEWLEQGSPGEDWPNPQQMQLQQLATDESGFQLQSSGGRFDDTSVSFAAADVLHLPACPSGANHACCRMSPSCTSGQCLGWGLGGLIGNGTLPWSCDQDDEPLSMVNQAPHSVAINISYPSAPPSMLPQSAAATQSAHVIKSVLCIAVALLCAAAVVLWLMCGLGSSEIGHLADE